MKVALGVTGCIAAYKAAELLREMQRHHLDVQVVMTRHAQEFVRPLTFAALSGQRVITEMFDSPAGGTSNVESAIEHIAVAQNIDLLLVAPATADILGKFAQGIADDFLSTLYLATKAPVVVAPAMNCEMWDHPAVQKNVEVLRQRGVYVVEPDSGYLACGMVGQGRLAENEKVLATVFRVLDLSRDLEGDAVLVTAGPTQEDIDPVRYISNRSSGKMGYALAVEALRRGARVILISGPTALEKPAGVEFVPVRSAAEMSEAVKAHFSESTIIIKAAAVADFRPLVQATSKIKKETVPDTLRLERTEDILAGLGKMKGERILVGFAAETGFSIEEARKKLRAKKADLLVVNDVTEPGSGFDVDTNHVWIIKADGSVQEVPAAPKGTVARELFDAILQTRRAHAIKAL